MMTQDLTVILQTLSDKPRLLARTHINRLGHHVLGKPSLLTASEQPDSDMVCMHQLLIASLHLCNNVMNFTYVCYVMVCSSSQQLLHW